MSKKVLIYMALILAIAVAVFAAVIYRQRAVGLSTGTPEVEDNTKAKGGLGGQWAEDAG